ncbi:MAG: hypothetical protein AAGD14_10475 [Planctomycetota bacterium]
MLELLVQFGILPAAVAGALLLAGGRRYADVGIGAAAAFVLVWLIDNGGEAPGWPPANSKEALPIGVLLAGLVTLVPGGQPWTRRLLFFVPASIGLYYVMSTQASVLYASVGAFFVAGWAVSAETLANRRPGAVLPLVWLVAFALTAGTFERAANLSAAQYVGAFAAASGAFFVLAGLRGLSVAGAALPFGLGLKLLIVNSHLFAELPFAAALLLFLAPKGAWIGELPWFRSKPWWLDWGARLGAVILIAGTALAITAAANAPAEDAPTEERNPYVDAFGDG